jgi:Tfp pilus assembly protein PilN
MSTLNLAPAQASQAQARSRQQFLVVLIVVLALIFALIWLSLFFFAANVERGIKDVESRLHARETEIAKLNEAATRVELFESRVNILSNLLANHLSWDPLLRELERLLPPSTVLTSLSADAREGKISLSGSAPTLDQLSQFVASLENKSRHQTLFTSVTIENAQRHNLTEGNLVVGANYVFSATFFFDPELLTSSNLSL